MLGYPHPSDHLTVDRQSLALAALFLVVIVPTAWLAYIVGQTGTGIGPPEAFGSGAAGEATAGAAWALLEIGFAVAILVAAFVYRRLPEWVQSLLITNAVAALAMYAGARGQATGTFAYYVGGFVALFTTYKVLDHFNVYWIANNVYAVILAIVGGLTIGLIFGVPGMVLAIVALTVYDHIFANKQSWMFTIGTTALKARLPVLVVKPEGWRMAWEDLIDMLDITDDEDRQRDSDDVWGIGTADLMIPAGFVAAVASTPSGVLAAFGTAAVGIVIAGVVVACFRLRHEMQSRGSGAGLPALSAGALIPYAALYVVALAA